MSFWKPSSWTWSWRVFCDISEYVSGVVAAACGIWVAVVKSEEKMLPAGAVCFAVCVTLSAKFAGKRIDSRSQAIVEKRNRERAENVAQSMLLNMQRYYFKDEDEVELHKHRFTLFKAIKVEDGPEKGNHLALFARAGDHVKSKVKWALDDNVVSGCRGVAGQVWSSRTTIFKEADCDWPIDGNASQKSQYADSLDMTVAEAETLNVKSRAFAGALVTVRGERWGVLLLDSLKAGAIQKPARKALLDNYAAMLGNALTEILT